MQIGDVVALRSGGPNMTVYRVDSDGELKCAFFHQGEFDVATFPPAALELVTPVQPDPQEAPERYGEAE